MTAEEYAQAWLADLAVADMSRDRNLQTARRILGVSDIGHCRSYAARFLNGDPFTDAPQSHQAMLGTWIHDAALPIIAAARGAHHEAELTVTLSNGFEVLGHADLIEPDEPSVTDLKTGRDNLPHARRHGANGQQKSQRHLYGAGAVQAGLVPEKNLIVRNIWVDVTALDEEPHVEQEPYDRTYLDHAATWVDEVMYTVDQGQVGDAPRDKDVFWCRSFCPFVTACRGPETVTDEVIQSDELATAAALHREGLALEKDGKALKASAKAVLERVQDAKVTVTGAAGTFRVASTWVNPAEVAFTRSGYYKTDVKEMR